MPPGARQAALERLVGILKPDSKARRREVISAARALIAADKLNLEQEKLALQEAISASRLDLDRQRFEEMRGEGAEAEGDYVVDLSAEPDPGDSEEGAETA